MSTKKLTFSALLIAMGVLLSNLIYIPIGTSRCFPIQHLINVLSAVMFNSYIGVGIAFCISVIRNILGTGSIMAFPGSMIGAFLAVLFYRKGKKIIYAFLGEVIGTGVIGALLCYPISKLILGKDVAALFYVIPFSISSVGGALIAYVVLTIISKRNIIHMVYKQ
ncbi:energy coupling factor transporter S component ThiW [Clostridium peptidivorans]|uniref:energy coupling factor transporter S component ThiW n=1 Tax=Clostridium peptidivorans TaxID=100174 RepID=UPI000BE273D2|nr:energy coupling factor transporter S component ThiW [Clostridium peptidivorans]